MPVLKNPFTVQELIAETPFFQTIDRKETFLIVIGGLVARLISLEKAAELMDMSKDSLLGLLDSLGIEFSYLTETDIQSEKQWD